MEEVLRLIQWCQQLALTTCTLEAHATLKPESMTFMLEILIQPGVLMTSSLPVATDRDGLVHLRQNLEVTQ